MDITRSICFNETGFRYQLSLSAIQEPELAAVEALIEAAVHLSQMHLCDIWLSFPEYLHADAAQKLAEFVTCLPENMRITLLLDAQPLPQYPLHPALQAAYAQPRSQRTRTLKDDFLLKQRQIRQLQIQISQIHYSIPGFRSNDYSHHRSPLPADLPVGDCTPQQLWVALMLNSGFNSFDPYEVVSDLYENPQLWHGFALLPNIETMTSEQHPNLWRRGYLRFLPMLDSRHHCDTLYILAADDEHVFRLVDFGKEWQADDVQVYTGEDAARLVGDYDDRALPVLRYWWD